jgi:Autophagy protein Atg8 ubiquitin like
MYTQFVTRSRQERACLPANPVALLTVNFKCFVVSYGAVRVAAAMMATVYEDHKDEDGFLYITYSGENTFGDFLEEWRD